MKKMINPELLPMYDWTYEENQDVVKIIVTGSKFIKVEDLIVEAKSEKNERYYSYIYVAASDQPPLVAGRTYEKFTEYIIDSDQKHLYITLKKIVDEPWPQMIRGPIPGNVIDPLSAFVLANILMEAAQEIQNPQELNYTLHQRRVFLELSAQVGFPEALVQLGCQCFNSQEIEKSKEYLTLAADKYNSDSANIFLGLHACKLNDNQTALERFLIAGKNGNMKAYVLASDIYSPFAEPHSNLEDPQKARQILEDVVVKEPDEYYAWYQLALYYKDGVGCSKDIERAKKCYIKSKELGCTEPPIDFGESSSKVLLFVVTISVTAMASILLFSIISNRRHR